MHYSLPREMYRIDYFVLGGIQLGRPQKIGLFGPPPPLVRIFVLKGQTPSHLGRPQGLTPPPKKREKPPKCMVATLRKFPTFSRL